MEDRNGLWRSQLSPAVVDELLAYLSRQALNVAFGVTLVSVVVLFFARAAPLWMSASLGLAVAIVAIARIYAVRLLPRQTDPGRVAPTEHRRRPRRVEWSRYGLCVFFWPFLTDLQRAMQTLIVTGLCTTAIVPASATCAPMSPIRADHGTDSGGLGARRPRLGRFRCNGDAAAVLALFAGSAAFLLLLARDTFRRSWMRTTRASGFAKRSTLPNTPIARRPGSSPRQATIFASRCTRCLSSLRR